MSTQPIFTDNPGSLPAQFTLPPGLDLRVSSIVARINGAGAAADFQPALAIYTQDGKLMARVTTTKTFSAGDSGVVTWAPFLRKQAAATPGGDTYHEAAFASGNGGTISDSTLTEVGNWTVLGHSLPAIYLGETGAGVGHIQILQSIELVISFRVEWDTPFNATCYTALSLSGAGNKLSFGNLLEPKMGHAPASGFCTHTVVCGADVATSPANLVAQVFQASGGNQVLAGNTSLFVESMGHTPV